jgi:hypothetical protein
MRGLVNHVDHLVGDDHENHRDDKDNPALNAVEKTLR